MSNLDPEQPLNSPASLAEVNALLKSKCHDLLLCQAAKIPSLQQEIQKLRVVARIFREVENDSHDDDLYKEMNLLNRMTVGRDLEQEADRREADESIKRAEGKLRDAYGIDSKSANRIARTLAAVAGRTEIAGPDTDDTEPQPISPAEL